MFLKGLPSYGATMTARMSRACCPDACSATRRLHFFVTAIVHILTVPVLWGHLDSRGREIETRSFHQGSSSCLYDPLDIHPGCAN